MSYAVIKIKHEQFILKPGDQIAINGTVGEEGKAIKLGEILLLNHNKLEIGTPQVKGDVIFKIVEHGKSKKIKVSTFKAKSRSRRTIGHRQKQTTLELVSAASLKADVVTDKKTTVPAAKVKPATKTKPKAAKKTTKKTAK